MTKKLTANEGIKAQNRSNIYQFLYDNGCASRQDIVIGLHISLPTVTQNLNNMIAEGLICEQGTVGNTGGRRATTYSIVPNAHTAIGLDITRNHVTAVVVNLCGEIIYTLRMRLKFDRSDAYYQRLGEIVETVILNSGIKKETLLGIGIGVPGLVTANNQTIFSGKILNFTGANCDEFSKYIPFPTALFNDANAAGFAEMWADKDTENAFYIMLSSNVGGAIIINNQVYSGECVKSGEVGHLQIVSGGKPCYCGQNGCMDAYCAATVLSSLTNENLQEFFNKLDQNDPECVKTWDEYLNHLATTVNMVRMLFDCKIILGGYVGSYMEKYIDDFRKRAKKLNSFEQNADYAVACKMKTESIASGCALHYINEFLKTI